MEINNKISLESIYLKTEKAIYLSIDRRLSSHTFLTPLTQI
jgi:hypothetical protein